jgi:hypothetical protein
MAGCWDLPWEVKSRAMAETRLPASSRVAAAREEREESMMGVV